MSLPAVLGDEEAETSGREAADHGDEDIASGLPVNALMEKLHRLQAERGERGEPSEDADGYKGSYIGRDGERPFRARQSDEETDDERAQNVDQDRSPWERHAGRAVDRRGH